MCVSVPPATEALHRPSGRLLVPPEPADVERHGRRRGLSVADIRAAVPPACFEIDPRRAWLTLARGVASLALAQGCLALVWHAGWPGLAKAVVLPVLWLWAGWSLTTVFVIGHDCGHRSFSRSGWVNSLVGHLVMAPLCTSAVGWRIGHNRHHAHTQKRGVDPEWPEKLRTRQELSRAGVFGWAYTLLAYASPVGVLLGLWVAALRQMWIPLGYPGVVLSGRERGRLAASTATTLLVSGSLIAALVWAGGVAALFFFYLVPMIVSATTGTLLTLLHHNDPDALFYDASEWTPFRGQVASTFEVRFPRLLEWMWLDINVHLPHHVSPRIPWYHLREASEAIRRAHPHCHQTRRFSWRRLLRLWSRPLLRARPSAGPGVYEAAPLRVRPEGP